jgi:hypothetical protein
MRVATYEGDMVTPHDLPGFVVTAIQWGCWRIRRAWRQPANEVFLARSHHGYLRVIAHPYASYVTVIELQPLPCSERYDPIGEGV